MISPYGNATDFVMVWSVDDVAHTAEQLRDVLFDRLASRVLGTDNASFCQAWARSH